MSDPQDVKSEEALLGAILVAPAATKGVAVTPDDFYNLKHGLIWAAAKKCANNGGADPITVAAELERRGQLEEVGGRDRLALLAATVPAAGNASAYAKRVAETAGYRRMRRSAAALLDAVTKADDTAIAQSLDALGHPIRYVDIDSGELVDTCPACAEREALIDAKTKRENGLLSKISRLEGKAEKKAKEHKLWDEIAACFDVYKLATAHFDVAFTIDEFNQAHPRWKQYGKGNANPCKPALRAICGIAYDPTQTRGRNKRQRVYDSWELLNRNQFSWADFHKRVPGNTDADWWRCLMSLIAGNLK